MLSLPNPDGISNPLKRPGFFPRLRSYIFSKLPPQQEENPNIRKKLTVTYIARNDPRRRIHNDKKLVDAMKNAGWKVDIMRMDSTPAGLINTLRKLEKTDVLMGVHGAGLAYAWLLPPTSILVELTDAFGNDLQLFRNVAAMSEVPYYRVNIVNDVSPDFVNKQGRAFIGEDSIASIIERVPALLDKAKEERTDKEKTGEVRRDE